MDSQIPDSRCRWVSSSTPRFAPICDGFADRYSRIRTHNSHTTTQVTMSILLAWEDNSKF
eukprot:226642-Prymnesium_polylepis.2